MTFLAGEIPDADDFATLRPIYAKCTAAVTVANTTLTDITGCSAALAASAITVVRGRVSATAGSTGDFALGWSLPSGATIDVVYAGYGSAGALALPLLQTVGAWGMGGGNLSATVYDTVLVDAVITTAATAGTGQLRGALNSATGSVIFKADSTYLTFQRVG